jgi:hypothetical protein
VSFAMVRLAGENLACRMWMIPYPSPTSLVTTPLNMFDPNFLLLAHEPTMTFDNSSVVAADGRAGAGENRNGEGVLGNGHNDDVDEDGTG